MNTAILEKEVNWASLELDGIDMRDAPDFSDAYFAYGEYTDGTAIEDAVLEDLSTGGAKYDAINHLFY